MVFNEWLQNFIAEKTVEYLSPDLLPISNRCLRLRVESAALGTSVNANSLYIHEGFNEVMNLSGLPTDAKAYFTDFFEDVQNLDIETSSELNDAITFIKNKEDNVIDDLEANGRYAIDMAFYMMAVARYSCDYWPNNFTDSSSKWYNMDIKFEDHDDWDIPVPAAKHWSEYAADDAAAALSSVVVSLGAVGPWGALASAALGTGWSIVSNNS